MINPFLLYLPLVLTLFRVPLPASLYPKSSNLQDIEICGGFVIYKDVHNNNIEYLLMKDAKHSAWELPGGQLEKNETLIQAALRETWEETGWLLYSDYQPDFRSEIYFVYERDNGVIRHAHFWPALLTNLDTEVKISVEHSQYKWMEFEEACQIIQLAYKDGFIRAHEIITRAHHNH